MTALKMERGRRATAPLVAVYLAAIVAANLLATELGPEVTIYTAFALIGLDLTMRDRLHDQWERDGLALRMAGLIAAGSALSYLVNRDAGRIALASMLAFGLASAVDAAVYHWRRRDPWMERTSVSNVLGAAVDSIVFPTVAFGVWLPAITFGQFTAKVAGGLVWALVIGRIRASRPSVSASVVTENMVGMGRYDRGMERDL